MKLINTFFRGFFYKKKYNLVGDKMKKFEKDINKFLKEIEFKLEYRNDSYLFKTIEMFNGKKYVILNIKNV